jgi:DNA-binding CsgD family transcriptional regulator
MLPCERWLMDARLSPTEVRIAVRVAAGQRNAEVAAQLGLTAKTVEWHLSRVYKKLGVRSRTELAVRGTSGENPWVSEGSG